jgi:hypothetical protein
MQFQSRISEQIGATPERALDLEARRTAFRRGGGSVPPDSWARKNGAVDSRIRSFGWPAGK